MLSTNQYHAIKSFTAYCLGAMYVYIGIKHFTDPQYFINITPPFIPFKPLAVYFTGVLEIFGGAFLFLQKTRKLGGIILIFLLVIVFPANIYLYISEIPRELLGITQTQALTRMPFQIPLIIIAYWHSKKDTSKRFDLVALSLFVPTILYFANL
tara:strand:+ start:750 stop:1211 length:462 start_codon:yes stop_codon:yes gene_type:complete